MNPHTVRNILTWAQPNKVRYCHYCGRTIYRETATWDHKIPKCLGGRNTADNLVLACKPCNNEKGMRDYAEFKESKLPLKKLRRELQSTGFGVR